MVLSALKIGLFAAVATVASAGPEEACNGQDTCEAITPMDAARASALMQVKADPMKTVLAQAPDPVTLGQSRQCAPASLQEAVHLEESRDCIPADLQEMHFQAVRRHAALLAAQTRRHAALLAAHAQMRKEKAGPPPSLEDLTTPKPSSNLDEFDKTQGGTGPSYCGAPGSYPFGALRKPDANRKASYLGGPLRLCFR